MLNELWKLRDPQTGRFFCRIHEDVPDTLLEKIIIQVRERRERDWGVDTGTGNTENEGRRRKYEEHEEHEEHEEPEKHECTRNTRNTRNTRSTRNSRNTHGGGAGKNN
jgi:hypothetical protein